MKSTKHLLMLLLLTGIFLCLGISFVAAAGTGEVEPAAPAKKAQAAVSLPPGALFGDEAHVFVWTPDKPMAQYQQAPDLEELERVGAIPKLRDRLPALPPICVPYTQIGEYGGTLRLVDTKYADFSSNGYLVWENLVMLTAPSPAKFTPNVAESFEVSDDLKSVTFRLRKGIKWSDNTELTTEDYRFHYYDKLMYSEDPDIPLKKVAPGSMIIGGEVVKLEIVDDYTMVFRFAAPIAEYVSNVFHYSNTMPWPAHYLKQFHPKYAENKDKEASEMMTDLTNMVIWSNPDVPTLGPYVADDVKLGEYMTTKRNPFYWKVDPAGNQLPYIDRFLVKYIKSPDVALLNVTAGEIDFEMGNVSYYGGPVLWQSQKSGNYSLVIGYPQSLFATITIQQAWIARALRGEIDEPNAAKLAGVLKNPKFVEALAHGIDTEKMTRAMVGADLADFMGEEFPMIPYLHKYAGVGTFTDNPKVKKLWDYVTEYQKYDIEKANSMLDELGLKIGSDGFREYPDGGRVELFIGIWDGNQKWFELHTVQGQAWERNLKIKTFVQLGNRATHVQTWLLNAEVPITGGNARPYDWVQGARHPLSTMYHIHGGYPISNWLGSDGEQGVEPYPEQKEILLRLKAIAQESGRTLDPQRKLELGIEATELVVYNGVTGQVVIGAQKSTPWILNNRIKNYTGGATIDQAEIQPATLFIEE